MAGMDLSEKSKEQKAVESGKAKVGAQERKVTKAARKTKEGKEKQIVTEEQRRKNEQLIKATLKQKGEGGNRDEDEWESAEEDYPHIQLDDLKSLQDQLAGMKIVGKDDDEEEDEGEWDEDEEDSDGEEVKAKGTKTGTDKQKVKTTAKTAAKKE